MDNAVTTIIDKNSPQKKELSKLWNFESFLQDVQKAKGTQKLNITNTTNKCISHQNHSKTTMKNWSTTSAVMKNPTTRYTVQCMTVVHTITTLEPLRRRQQKINSSKIAKI